MQNGAAVDVRLDDRYQSSADPLRDGIHVAWQFDVFCSCSKTQYLVQALHELPSLIRRLHDLAALAEIEKQLGEAHGLCRALGGAGLELSPLSFGQGNLLLAAFHKTHLRVLILDVEL